ncbi:unnamed protein product [Callosobruchus maculatus]|uniref:THAP-type domain-containing protein n=1 Tax=Callosobruchus maculatus TaxID=64391 RepID=A0A653BMI7_CALMS|nr:unnamed protein product [Callosobruchus maculatus]
MSLTTASGYLARVKRACKYPSCLSKYYSTTNTDYINKKFHRFPKDPVISGKWKDICKISADKDCSHFYICDDHFDERDYINASLKLTSGSVPRSPSKCRKTTTTTFNVETMSNIENVPNNNDNVSSTVTEVLPDVGNETVVRSVIENSECTMVGAVPDHNYSSLNTTSTQSKLAFSDKYSFLSEKTGILQKSGLSKSDLTPQEEIMYQVHRNTLSKLSKLRNSLKQKNSDLMALRNLYNDGRFQFIEESLNDVTKNFINSQLRNVTRAPTARRWTIQDKAFALSLYKRSPKLYRYLKIHFQLPSISVLKKVLSSVPFNCGLIKPVMDYLKLQSEQMDELDKCCTLIFDEVSLASGLYYDSNKQTIFGYEDLGFLGRSRGTANHALVFMIRGIKTNYKMPVAFFFTKNSIATDKLKQIIIHIIEEIQSVGFNIVATVCDQGSTNRAAITALTKEHTDEKPSQYHFVVNNQKIVTIFDVPHLLKNTRNALQSCNIEFQSNKVAKFKYIEQAFQIDRTERTYRCLPKLKESFFNSRDSFLKMKVKVAAQQLSNSVAAAIETFCSNTSMPAEALLTAEFVSLIDTLFDSLNSSSVYSQSGKKFRSALSNDSPHIEFWSNLLPKFSEWKLFDKETGKLHTAYKFIEGWQISIRAIMVLWSNLKEKGFKYLLLRTLNQDPLENLFGQIRQHGITNTNPTCYQFIAALKTVIINNFGVPLSKQGNCEEDYCKSVGDFSQFLQNYAAEEIDTEEISDSSILDSSEAEIISGEASAYVAGYFLNKINIPDCSLCKQSVFADDASGKHLFVMFKEVDDVTRLKYAHDQIINLVDTIHTSLYHFLDQNGHLTNIENRFKTYLKEKSLIHVNYLCTEHNCLDQIIDKCVRINLYKYVRDQKVLKRVSDGHSKKLKKFKAL